MVWPSFDYFEIKRVVFTPEECAAIMARAESPSEAGQLPGTRDCSVFWLSMTGREWIADRMVAAARESNYRFDFDRHSDAVQLASYGPGQRYDWHMDLGPGAMSLRKLTIVAELQAAFGSGLEIFPMGDIHLGIGDVAVFPSFVMHRATAPREGTRWSLTMWLCGKEPLC
jgi:PKHD-type hydroxylase